MPPSFGARHEGTPQSPDAGLVTQLEPVAKLLAPSRRMVVFTGAGISTESGIPDYRGPDGVWQTNRIPTAASVPKDAAAREERWQQHRERYPKLQARTPNAGHLAITSLERHRRVKAIITQNIDGLHESSGVAPDKIVELHGNGTYAACLDCSSRHELSEIRRYFERTETPPACECGGFIKSATISFGQAMPQHAMRRAREATLRCDLFIAIGSSLVVYPAAGFPVAAKENGAALVILNREPTPLDDCADLVLRGDIGDVLAPFERANDLK
jgi:NAD-dependent deacetylase